MGQSEFMVKKRNLPPLLSFSALLVCILPHCRLRDWCGNMRKASGHVVCRLDQSASFRIFDSTFYFPHSAIPHFTHSPHHPTRLTSTGTSRVSRLAPNVCTSAITIYVRLWVHIGLADMVCVSVSYPLNSGCWCHICNAY